MLTLTPDDKELLLQKGISEDELQRQLERFKVGFPFLKLADSAKIGQGIIPLDSLTRHNAVSRWKRYLDEEGDVIKFTPASGAATRMFKNVHSFVNGDTDSPSRYPDIIELTENLKRLPFYPALNDACLRMYGRTAEQIKDEGRLRELFKAMLDEEGMNYGNLPKGLLLFHSYPYGQRTALEEQLIGAAKTIAVGGVARIHFTVSEEHLQLFRDTISRVAGPIEDLSGTVLDISLSTQKPSTDTVAANLDDTPHYEDGHLMFRPGGHGSLIENLNDIDASVIFIKNIDNVVPENLAKDELNYKRVLGGILIQVRDTIHRYIAQLSKGHSNPDLVREAIDYMRDVLSIEDSRFETLKEQELIDFILAKLNRPIRVCGMVRNEGEPGGGPFLAYGKDGSIAPQILESSQIDPSNRSYSKMLHEATHFNPVDLVCYVKDANGKKFNLTEYIDSNTGFITQKSIKGKPVLAMERPGLWNGAMSDWNTVFVEVPVTTFNPVKTVNDLLRPTHNPS